MTNGRSARILGAVLAGGASTRFGSPKWRAPLAGTSLGERALASLSTSLQQTVVISADPGSRVLGREVWPDLVPGDGPLGGILTALSGARRRGLAGVFVLACDLPLVGASLVSHMVSRWREEDAFVPLGPGGPEPLCALYSVRSLSVCEEVLQAGERSVHGLLEQLDAEWIPLTESIRVSGREAPFLNVNTPADLDRARGFLQNDA